MDERIKKIANYYGYESQREQFIEECAEMIQASQKCKRTDIQNAQQYRERFDNFQEEVADVLIMAQQLRYLLGARDIDDIIDKKLDRQIQRIKDESAPETAELPEVNTEGMQSGEIRTARNGDAWKSVMKI